MKMRKLTWLLAFILTLHVSAQEGWEVMGKGTDMYILYPASGNESLQGISNSFGIAAAKLSAYNHINIKTNAILAKGTQVKIPVTKNSLLQQPAENSAPVVHVIRKGDNLFRLSQEFNKVPVASMRSWNHLKKDVVKDGQRIIVGYMVNAKPAEKKTANPKETIAALPSGPVVVTEAEKKPAPVLNELPAAKAAPSAEAAPAPMPVKKESAANDYVPKEGDEGYFAAAYAAHGGSQAQQFHSGDAAVFKTISGWTDRKFYVLMNDVPPKTVVRVTGPTNKSICAMVLGPLQETKGANGLMLRLSNSAASAIGVTDPKFTVTVTWFE